MRGAAIARHSAASPVTLIFRLRTSENTCPTARHLVDVDRASATVREFTGQQHGIQTDRRETTLGLTYWMAAGG
ncbi:hypothetical protein [Nonomuraea glycinis]|uniref:hypothetical protein n=1 Tax=Nonomuraea glycinis TaxID=2047744 RepID=UPI0033B6210F